MSEGKTGQGGFQTTRRRQHTSPGALARRDCGPPEWLHTVGATGAIVGVCGVLGRDRTRVGSVGRSACKQWAVLCCAPCARAAAGPSASLTWRESVCTAAAESTVLRRGGRGTAARVPARAVAVCVMPRCARCRGWWGTRAPVCHALLRSPVGPAPPPLGVSPSSAATGPTHLPSRFCHSRATRWRGGASARSWWRVPIPGPTGGSLGCNVLVMS